MKKYILFLAGFVLVSFFIIQPTYAARFNQLLRVFVANDDNNPIPVLVKNNPTVTPSPTGVQEWEHWYQCHPNPTNEQEIRGYLNDRGREGFEVVAAAGVGNLICEYYKKPKQ